MFAPTGAAVQLPQLQPQVSAALDRAIQTGNPRAFMQLAGRAQLTTAQAMEYLRQNVQRAGGNPSEGAQRIGAALQQRLQTEQPQPRTAPGGEEQPGAGQQQGGGLFDGLLNGLKAFGNWILSLFGLGGNQGQQPQPGQQRTAPRPPQ
ncbi:MAG TPA: hypothetical protein VLC93_04745 [Myxococcota bacterium]|nr:hypothetical protein [Myxococcota bacterium]